MDGSEFCKYNCTNNGSRNEYAYNNYFKNNSFIMLLIDYKTMKIEDANITACQFYQYGFEEIIELTIADRHNPQIISILRLRE